MKLLVLGTSSGAGKTTVAAMICRYLHNKGEDVVPFKGSNLSLDCCRTADGGRIGVGQRFQALACGKEPQDDMNPVLLVPTAPGCMDAYMDGNLDSHITRDSPLDRERARKHVHDAFRRLESEHGFVVCEGSGSPAEINLYKTDLANTGLMRSVGVPAVLVGDIERGGVFAALYGTWRLIPDDLKPLLRGFIINRFRGDGSILRSGIEKVEELTGMKCLGVLRYEYLRFPSEDSLSIEEGKLEGDDPEQAYLDNLDEMIRHAEESGFRFDLLEEMAR